MGRINQEAKEMDKDLEYKLSLIDAKRRRVLHRFERHKHGLKEK